LNATKILQQMQERTSCLIKVYAMQGLSSKNFN
jgi:hypothetical protein